MKGQGMFFTTLLTLDTFLVAFFFGFNSRHVLVIDPALPPVKPPHAAKPATPAPMPHKTTIKPTAEAGKPQVNGRKPKSVPGESSHAHKKPNAAGPTAKPATGKHSAGDPFDKTTPTGKEKNPSVAITKPPSVKAPPGNNAKSSSKDSPAPASKQAKANSKNDQP